MRRQLYYIGIFLFAVGVIAAQPWTLSQAPADSPRTRSRSLSAARENAEPSPYYLLCPLSRFPVGSLNCFMPKYMPTEHSTAQMYASFFHMTEAENAAEEEDAYRFANQEGTLTVYKYARKLHYESVSRGKASRRVSNPPTSDPEWVAQAVAFMEKNLLFLSYEEARVTKEDAFVTVTFIERLDNLKNFAFNNTVTLDKSGHVLQADYYFIHYDKLSTCKIKSMRDAFAELPPQQPEGRYVNITGCTLVYTYANSIVQPAYMFEGETSDGQAFEYFIKAAVYGE